MFPTDVTGELSRQRLARSLPTRPTSRPATLRHLAAAVLLAAAPVAVLLIETAGKWVP